MKKRKEKRKRGQNDTPHLLLERQLNQTIGTVALRGKLR